MLNVDDLEIGKVYYVKIDNDGLEHWLFKKDVASPRTHVNAITSCRYCMCIDDDFYHNDGYASHVCYDHEILDLRIANLNHIAIWNRTFNDNMEMI